VQLERDAPYVQIIEHYRRQIAAGQLTDGDMLPSGREIAAEFGVSVVTAPRPPADRAQGGPLLITLAARTPPRPGLASRVLEAAVAQAPPAIAAQLGTGPLADVIRRRQATVKDDETVALLTSWHPASLAETCPALLDVAYADGDIPGYDPAWGEDWLTARPPTSAEAREFGIKRGSPVLVATSRRFNIADRVIEYAELITRADTRVEYRYHYQPAAH
jgi:DNA-binding GntR family transcriptional regulator